MSLNVYLSIPLGSLMRRSKEEEDKFLEEIRNLPPTVFSSTTSLEIAAFLRGILKNYEIPPDMIEFLSFTVLEVAYGFKKLESLGSLISSRLRVDNSTAQKIASEIEGEVFAPNIDTFKHYWNSKGKNSSRKSDNVSGGAKNVVNLKSDTPKPQAPPPRKKYPLPPRVNKPKLPPR